MSAKSPDFTAKLEYEVTALTVSPTYAPIRGNFNETPSALRAHPGPVRVGTTVFVHGSGHWRPGVVERASTRNGVGVYTVVHASPSNPTRMYRKRVHLEELRLRA